MDQNKFGGISLGILLVLLSASLFVPTKSSLEEQAILEIPAQQEETTEPLNEQQDQEMVENQEIVQEDLTVTLVNEVVERIANQEKVDAMIQAEVESGYYTPENPLVILDPYNQSPLTALICFTTEIPTQVHIHIEGEDEYTEVNHTFGELVTQHVLPVYGLYPDKSNPVTISVFNETLDIVAENLIEIQTEPLADHFQDRMIITETFSDGYQEGINFLYSYGKMAFDKKGDIRWYYSKTNYGTDTDYNYNNHFICTASNVGAKAQPTLLFEMDKLGKIYTIFFTPYGIHHDIFSDGVNSLFSLGHDPIGGTQQDFIIEIDIVSGEIVNTLDLKTLLQRSRPAWTSSGVKPSQGLSDWLHMNSIVYDESDGTITISTNYQSAVVKMDWPSGDIHWISGNHDDWNPRLQQYLLTPIGDDFEWHYNQHAVEILPDYDNNPDTIDILLFDNGSTRFIQDSELQRKIVNLEIVAPDLYSRIVHYRINEIDRTIEQIFQYGKERGLELFSAWRSDADLLDNGDFLGMFCQGFDVNHPVLAEVSQKSELVWEAEIFKHTSTGSYPEYRAERLPFYFDDDAEHDIYSTARNLIPDDIMQFVQNYNENPPIIPTEGENTDETQTEDTN